MSERISGFGQHAVECVDANTEYSIVLERNIVMVKVRSRDTSDVRMAFDSGRVAAPIPDYITLHGSDTAWLELSHNLVGVPQRTLYFASDTAGAVAEIIVGY